MYVKWSGIYYEGTIRKDLLLHFNNAKVKDCHKKCCFMGLVIQRPICHEMLTNGTVENYR